MPRATWNGFDPASFRDRYQGCIARTGRSEGQGVAVRAAASCEAAEGRRPDGSIEALPCLAEVRRQGRRGSASQRARAAWRAGARDLAAARLRWPRGGSGARGRTRDPRQSKTGEGCDTCCPRARRSSCSETAQESLRVIDTNGRAGKPRYDPFPPTGSYNNLLSFPPE